MAAGDSMPGTGHFARASQKGLSLSAGWAWSHTRVVKKKSGKFTHPIIGGWKGLAVSAGLANDPSKKCGQISSNRLKSIIVQVVIAVDLRFLDHNAVIVFVQFHAESLARRQGIDRPRRGIVPKLKPRLHPCIRFADTLVK